jgi:hypothetical protein
VKLKTIRQKYTDQHTRDGITVPITRTRDVKVPALPRDWDALSTRAAVGLVLVLTAVSVVWSTWSIGAVMHGGIGYGAAVIFDFSWAVCLILEWKARFDPAKREFPRRLGWALLLATMGAISWHGIELHSYGMAVTGAAVSAVAKVLWLGVMLHIERDLSPEDQQWVAAQISAAHAKMAVADARRQAARIEQRATVELLAMEREQAHISEAFGLSASVQNSAVATPDMADAPGTPVHDMATATPDMADAPGGALPQHITQAIPGDLAPEEIAAALAVLERVRVGMAPAPAGNEDDSAHATGEDDAQDDALPPLEPPALATLNKSDAIRIAFKRRPDYTPAQVAELLAAYDVHTTADYVRQVINRDRQAPTGDVVPIRKTL